MAATTLNLSRLPIARPTSVDLDFGGTLAAKQIRVTGVGHFARDGYLVLGSDVRASPSSIDEAWPQVTLRGDVAAAMKPQYVIVGEQTLALSGNVTAATCSRTFSPIKRSGFFPDVAVVTSESWWTGLNPSKSVSIKVHDKRLEPLFDRLARIERGEWDSQLGRAPNARALRNAKAVLGKLSGGPITPKRVVGGDGMIAFYFTMGPKYSTIEVLNNGSALLLSSDGLSAPEVRCFRLADLASILDKILAHIS
jgi:hypothetical protein